MNIEIRKLTAQEREHYTHCPCCGTRIRAQTAEEFAAIVMKGFALASQKRKEERRLRKAQEK